MSKLPTVTNPTRELYPSDMSDAEWALIEPKLPAPKGFGRPREVNFREILNAIFYVQSSVCQWEMLPHDFPPHSTVYKYFRKWQRKGIWQTLHDDLRKDLREGMNRDPDSSVAIADSQSVKNDGKKGEVYGFDGGKKVKGRKRHIVVDSQGFVLGVLVTEANMSERLGAVVVFDAVRDRLSRLEVVCVDQGYSGENFARAIREVCGEQVRVEVIKRTSKTFEVLPKRWIVERTFGWLNRYRRLSKDYEVYTELSEAMIYGALIRLMLKRAVA
ncbi:IS5 family transposase [Phormidium tenue]|uniref:IS5 family transposase n=1 Tax=Phormidium tenue TaxID=126344 RepID=UPI0018EFAD48|nr:IS5 family transposase [Phormidium tenue]